MGFSDIFRVKQFKDEIIQRDIRLKEFENLLQVRDNKITEFANLFNQLGVDRYEDVTEKVKQKESEIQVKTKTINDLTLELASLKGQTDDEFGKLHKLMKKSVTQDKKMQHSAEIYRSIRFSLQKYVEADIGREHDSLVRQEEANIEEFYPSVIMKLHSLDVKSLREQSKSNQKQIDEVLNSYSSRYTTKANKQIYQLMVLGLRSELQNILSNLKYEKLDTALAQVRNLCQKYVDFADEGNQAIASTQKKFIGQLEYLFFNAVKIEYSYYVKKEQEKQEKIELRQQLREEEKERKALEIEKKRIEAEEAKFSQEIDRNRELLSTATSEEAAVFSARILELEAQLSSVALKKEEISKLQHGKAGTVYIISNVGAFGDKIFKIGMTRRLEPLDRINELGSASVPFKFDIHSLIFSDNAVGLEASLHQRLGEGRVNKVNLRKEFFYSSIDELEELVNELDPTAEFIREVEASEYSQSESTDEVYEVDQEDLDLDSDLELEEA